MGGGKLMAILHFINVYGTIIMMPIAFFTFLPWPVRDIGASLKRSTGKDNWLLKLYRILMKIHIPCGVYVLVVGIFHTIFASINHGWGVNLGMATLFFYLVGFIVFLFRKKIGPVWVPIHRVAEYVAIAIMFIHCVPALPIIFGGIAKMIWHNLFG